MPVMARRVWPRKMPGASKIPSSSGPRCLMSAIAARAARRSGRASGRASAWPTMPHMALLDGSRVPTSTLLAHRHAHLRVGGSTRSGANLRGCTRSVRAPRAAPFEKLTSPPRVDQNFVDGPLAIVVHRAEQIRHPGELRLEARIVHRVEYYVRRPQSREPVCPFLDRFGVVEKWTGSMIA